MGTPPRGMRGNNAASDPGTIPASLAALSASPAPSLGTPEPVSVAIVRRVGRLGLAGPALTPRREGCLAEAAGSCSGASNTRVCGARCGCDHAGAVARLRYRFLLA